MTTGAENDLEHASSIARQMAGRWGMSPAIGPVTVLPPPGQESPYGLDGVAPATRELVDTEARKIIEECYEQAVATLRGSRDRLDRLAHALLQRETLDEDEAYAAAGVERATAPAVIARSQAPAPAPALGIPPVAAARSNPGPGLERLKQRRPAAGLSLIPGAGRRCLHTRSQVPAPDATRAPTGCARIWLSRAASACVGHAAAARRTSCVDHYFGSKDTLLDVAASAGPPNRPLAG